MEYFIQVMKALSDSNRVKIVKILQERSLCVCEIQEALELAQPAVSRHLKQLERAGLVTYQKEGLWVNYRLTDGSASPYAACLLGNLRHWMVEDREIHELLKEKLPKIKRGAVCKR